MARFSSDRDVSNTAIIWEYPTMRFDDPAIKHRHLTRFPHDRCDALNSSLHMEVLLEKGVKCNSRVFFAPRHEQ